jgi:HlyD family secretion protein
MRLLLMVLALMGVVAGAGAWYWESSQQTRPEYRVAKITRGDLLASISSTGTLEPQQVIDVGAQVVGLVESFGKDSNGSLVDYRSPVDENMVLAQIDDAVYKADLNTAKAQLDQANSAFQKGQADVKEAKAKLKQADGNWKRAQTLVKTDALSESDYEMYEANFDTATADVAVADAEVTQAQATIAAAKAALDKAQRNLDFCVIRSPVKGVIIDRRVNIGQTVVSSLDAPSLFLIAKDLSKMQVWVAVNEADIDHVKPGQKVTFTCDALEGETFSGVVNKVRLNASITQNVVTYTVEVDADNPNGRLLPYMTANVEFEVHRDPDVLLVPNSALRWYPGSAAEVVADARAQWKPVEDEDNQATETSPPNAPVKLKRKKERHGTLWTREGQFVRPIDVLLGPTDNLNTEVSATAIKEGIEVVVGDQIENPAGANDGDPFLPKMNGHR